MSIIKKIANKILLAKAEKNEGNLKSYIRKIENGDFVDRLCYGISDTLRGFYSVDPVKSPGALYCGSMGSGKSEALKFTTVTNFVANAENTLYILIDPAKGMNEYKALFPYKKNVVKSFNDVTKVVPVIEMVFQEMEKRKEIFSKDGIKAKNIYEYESLTGKKIARIMICFEEFHTIPNADCIKFAYNYEKEGSVANKLRVILRAGRSYGVTVMAATQRATSDDFPSTLKPGISTMMAFKMSTLTDAAAMNLSNAGEIRSGQKGKCAYEGGFMQFPWFPEEKSVEKLIEKYYKPLAAELLAFQVKDYHEALSGVGNDGMVKIKPLSEILSNKDQYNVDAIAERFLESFGYKIMPKQNAAMSVSLMAEKDGKKIAILVIKERRMGGGKKTIEAFAEGAKILDCNKAIILAFESPPMGIDSIIKLDEPGVIVDIEDLQRIAIVMDNKELLEEKGQFEILYSKLALAEKVEEKIIDESSEESVDLDELLKDLNSVKKNKKEPEELGEIKLELNPEEPSVPSKKKTLD